MQWAMHCTYLVLGLYVPSVTSSSSVVFGEQFTYVFGCVSVRARFCSFTAIRYGNFKLWYLFSLNSLSVFFRFFAAFFSCQWYSFFISFARILVYVPVIYAHKLCIWMYVTLVQSAFFERTAKKVNKIYAHRWHDQSIRLWYVRVLDVWTKEMKI